MTTIVHAVIFLQQEKNKNTNSSHLSEAVLEGVDWQHYETFLFLLMADVQDDREIEKLSEEELSHRVDETYKIRFGKTSSKNLFKVFSKRHLSFPYFDDDSLGQGGASCLAQYKSVRKDYFSGNCSKILSDALALEQRILRLPELEDRMLLSLLLADLYLTIGSFFRVVSLCFACANSSHSGFGLAIRAAALSMLGDIAFGKGHYNIALLRYHQAQAIWETQSRIDCLSIVQADIARSYSFLGNYREAFSAAQRATNTASESEDPESLGYCLLTEVEIASRIRDADLAQAKVEEYRQTVSYDSRIRNSQWEMYVFAKYFIERREFKQGLQELLHGCLLLNKLRQHEHMPDFMVLLASYLNYEGLFDDALSVLLECYEHYPEFRSYRFALFLQWLYTIEVALRGNDQVSLAQEVSSLIIKFKDYNVTEVKGTVLGESAWWQTATLLEELIDSIRGLQPRFFSRYGLLINLYTGEIFKEGEIDPVHTLEKNQTKVFRLLALNPGKCYNNLDIIRSYDPQLAEYYKDCPSNEVPRRDNHYIPLLRKLFLRLCGNRIIETKRGSGYFIPEL